MLPRVHGGFIGEAKYDLEFVVSRRWCENTRTQVAGEVGGELFAFMQPGNQFLIAAMGDATGNHQRDG